jgi:hypothetical protein
VSTAPALPAGDDTGKAAADFLRRRRLSILGILVALAALALLNMTLADRFDPRRRGEQPDRILYLPRGESLNYMSLGYRGLAADMVWLRGIMYVGGKLRRDDTNYEWMEKIFQVATDLDPHWTRPYHAGAILLSALPEDDERAMALLKRGLFRNPWNVDIPFQAAQLNLVRERRKESLRYLNLMDRCMLERMRRPELFGRRLKPHEEGILNQVRLVKRELLKEGGDYRGAVTIAVLQLSDTDDVVLRGVGSAGYREALAHLLEAELTGAAMHYKSVRGRRPVEVEEILSLPAGRLSDGRAYPAIYDHFLKRMTKTCNKDRELAARILAMLPADPLGMKLYVRPDGTVHSRGLERLEYYRITRSVNLQLENFRKETGRPARDLVELVLYVRRVQQRGDLGPGSTRFWGEPAKLPYHPAGPDGWKGVRLNSKGLLDLPPGPAIKEMLSAPLPMPAGPRERARRRSAAANQN